MQPQIQCQFKIMPSKKNHKKNQLQIRAFFRNFLIFFTFLTAGLVNANAQQSNTYMIEGVAANASAKSSGEAKIIATNNARRNAFIALLSRLSMNPNTADTISNDRIFDMVRSEQITEERISGSSYSAVFNILFAKNAVDKAINVQKTIVSEESYLLIPVKILQKKEIDANAYPSKYALWEGNNDWKVAMEEKLKEKALTKFIIPEGDINNIAIINQDNVDRLEYSELEPIMNKYKVTEAFVVFFAFDDIENKVSISVQDIKKLQKKRVKLSFVNVDFLKYKALLSKVSEKTIDYLINSKSTEAVAMETSLVKIEIPIANLAQWMSIKNKIETSNLVSQMNIDAISKDYVVISVGYVEGQVDIVDAFAKADFTLEKKSEDFYRLYIGVQRKPATLSGQQ